MPAGRKPRRAPETIVVTDADTPGLPTVVAAFDEHNALQTIEQSERESAVRAIATQLGYQLPGDYADPDLIQRDIALNMRRSVEACLEVGRGLRVLKEACEHGEFIARLGVLGIESSVAQRFMQAAGKFSNAATSRHLMLAIGTQSKLLEMLVLDDEQIEELIEIGQTGSLKLDDVATMSVKELRKALRELRENNDAQANLLADKANQIDHLKTQLLRVKKLPPDEELDVLRKEASGIAFETEALIHGSLRPAFEALTNFADVHEIPQDQYMAGMAAQVMIALKQLCSEFNIPLVQDGDDAPAWLRDTLDEMRQDHDPERSH